MQEKTTYELKIIKQKITQIRDLINSKPEVPKEELGEYHIKLLDLYRVITKRDLTIANKINKEVTIATVLGKLYLEKLTLIMSTDTTDIYFNSLIVNTNEKKSYSKVKPNIKLSFGTAEDEYYWLVNRVGIIGVLHILLLMYTECK